MSGQKILLIDDDKDLVDILSRKLDRLGYDVSYAVDGIQGSILAHRLSPDLIILDILLPAKDGLGIMEDLERSVDTMLIPVIVLTAVDLPEKKKKAEEYGAIAYITKPFDEEDLLRRVKDILGD